MIHQASVTCNAVFTILCVHKLKWPNIFVYKSVSALLWKTVSDIKDKWSICHDNCKSWMLQ